MTFDVPSIDPEMEKTMATFRVYIRLPTTPATQWNFAETVVAKDATTALGRAYADWQNSKPSYSIPALSLCPSKVDAKTSAMRVAQRVSDWERPAVPRSDFAAIAASESPAQQQFIAALQDKVSSFLSTRLDGTYSVVIYPAGFNYGITYGNDAYWNNATLESIDTLLGSNSSGVLELTGQRFSTMYSQILQAVAFVFSQGDTATMQSQDAATSSQIASILTEFLSVGGTYTNPPPFGGKLQDVFNQLTKQYGDLTKLPDTMNALRNAIASYKALAGASYALHSRYYLATERLAAAIANTRAPAAGNGGMQTDKTSFFVGYTPDKLPTANQLIGSLQTKANAVNVQLTLSSFSSHSATLSVSGQAGGVISIEDIVNVTLDGGASYTMSDFTSSASTVTMDIAYQGVTVVGTAPTPLSTDDATGWYANDIVEEVAAKTGKDATGFQLQGTEYDVSELFGQKGSFSRLKSFVISQFPTVSMTFKSADSDKLSKSFQVHASVKVDLLGLFDIGSASASYAVDSVTSNASDGSVTVTFAAPAISGTTPLQQQVAYVMGGVASYPPDHI